MVIFHSYVKLLEGNTDVRILKQENTCRGLDQVLDPLGMVASSNLNAE